MHLRPYIATVHGGPIDESTSFVVCAMDDIHAWRIASSVVDDTDAMLSTVIASPIYIDGVDPDAIDALIVDADGVNGIDIVNGTTCAIALDMDTVTPVL